MRQMRQMATKWRQNPKWLRGISVSQIIEPFGGPLSHFCRHLADILADIANNANNADNADILPTFCQHSCQHCRHMPTYADKTWNTPGSMRTSQLVLTLARFHKKWDQRPAVIRQFTSVALKFQPIFNAKRREDGRVTLHRFSSQNQIQIQL
jgi:hypothetical protein